MFLSLLLVRNRSVFFNASHRNYYSEIKTKTMIEFFQNLDPLLRMFWLVALPTSLIFVFQTISTFMGVDSGDGIDADFDGDLTGAEAPFQIFSLRNLINFLLGFGWAGISFYDSISNKTLLIAVALLIGVVFLFAFFLIIKQLQKLAEDNSFKMSSTINKTAEVYLTIPEAKKGKGKILISINGSVHELDAMTEGPKIPSGATVKVTKIILEEILLVETI